MLSLHLGMREILSLLIGLNMFCVVTDHKPLVPLINTKDLSETPLRCQRMFMRLMRFNVKAKHVPGKDILVADTLSHSPVSTTESSPMRKFKPMSVTSSHHGKCQMQDWPRSEKCTPRSFLVQTPARSTVSGLTTSETDPSICMQSRQPLSPEVRSSINSLETTQ